jgi:hypothetical protein
MRMLAGNVCELVNLELTLAAGDMDTRIALKTDLLEKLGMGADMYLADLEIPLNFLCFAEVQATE